MKPRFLLPLALLFCVNAYSQYGFRPGYIEKHDGTTEDGLINLHGSGFNAKKCEFKKTEESASVVYLPEDIDAYRITNSKYFVSKKVAINGIETNGFLECLISGVATIYYTSWEQKDVFFLEKEGVLTQINNDEIKITGDGGHADQITNTHQYIGVLKVNFNDYPEIWPKVETSDFSKNALIKLSKKYNDYICKDKQCIIYEKTFRIHFRVGADFSYGISKMNYLKSGFKFGTGTSDYFQGNINMQLNLDEEGAFNIQGSLGYFACKYNLLNGNTFNPTVLTPNDVHYDISMLKPAIQLKYKINNKKITPFVSLGLFTTLFLKDKGTIHNNHYNQTQKFNSRGFDESKSLNMAGETGEIGVEIGKYPGSLVMAVYNDYYFSSPFSKTYCLGIRCGYLFK